MLFRRNSFLKVLMDSAVCQSSIFQPLGSKDTSYCVTESQVGHILGNSNFRFVGRKTD
jgi:hypothetical protein